MTYIITGKEVYTGDLRGDSPAPTEVTEIATELIITRLKLIDMLQKGEISADDSIVTRGERKCLYTKIFKRVYSWSEFTAMQVIYGEVIDLLNEQRFMQLAGGEVKDREIPYLPFYRNYERDAAILNNIDWSNISNYDTTKPFIVLVFRRRPARPNLNMTDEFWVDYLEILKANNITTFIFGKDTEQFADGVKTFYIKNFQDWCTIAHHPNCKSVVSTMTGAVYPCLMFGASGMNMTLIDNTNLMQHYSYDPSFYHPCINFAKVNIDFINYIPTAQQLYDRTTKNL